MNNSKFTIRATVTFLILLALLHIIKQEIDPTWRFISEYSIGKNGWLMSVAFFAWASAHLFLFMSLRKQLKNLSGKIGLIMLLVSAAGLILAGIFTTDPVTAETHTTSGNLHSLGGTLGLAMPFAALFIAISLSKNPDWTIAKRSIIIASVLTISGTILAIIALGYLFSENEGKIGPGIWVGIPNRIELLIYCSWLIIVARSSGKIENHSK